MLLVEYLESDLTFDPSRRANKVILNNLLQKDATLLHSSYSQLTSTPQLVSTPSFQTPDTTRSEPLDNAEEPSSEEIDVVEQVYGTSERLTWMDEVDLIEPPAAAPLKNRDLEAAAWSTTRGSINGMDGVPPENRVKHTVEDLSLEEYAERMNTAAAMLAQLNLALSADPNAPHRGAGGPATQPPPTGASWWPSMGLGAPAESPTNSDAKPPLVRPTPGTKPQRADAEAIKKRIMQEMDLLEEERMRRMRVGENEISMTMASKASAGETDEDIIRKELKRDDPSAAIFRENWQEKKVLLRSLH
jgi:phosphatidylinositol 4-kinase B